MNKLDELIQQLCPNGVPYRRLGDIATICRGGSFQKKDFTESGVPCIHYGQIYTRYGLFVNETITYIGEETAQKQKFAEPNDVVMAVTSENIEDVCKCVAWLGDGKVAVSGHAAIIHHSMNPKYLVYWLHSSSFYQQKAKIANGTKVIEVAPAKLSDVVLPVPPLEIQHEIVRILDTFTELTAELTARKQQYAYYRDKLLAFGDDVPKDTLENLCDFQYGKGNSIPTAPGEYPVYGCNGIVGTTNVFNSIDAPVIGHIGSAGIVNWGKGKHFVTYNGTICKVRPEKMISRYAYHLLCSLHLERFVKWSQPFLSYSDFAKETVAVPPLNIQQRVVSILDRFDTLCTDLSSGLPAEIEARQKQYEYYRDNLLSFTPAD